MRVQQRRFVERCLVLSLCLLWPTVASASAMDFVQRLKSTGVWQWTSRTQEMHIVQLYDGSRWDQRLLSYERWTAEGEYGQLSVMLTPPAMAKTRILGLFQSGGENLRWLFADLIGRPRRLPPSRAEGFLGNVFAGMTALQRVPFLLRQQAMMHLEAPAPDTYVMTLPYDDAFMTLRFRTDRLLLEELEIKTPTGAPVHHLRLGGYQVIQGVPTPMTVRIAVPERDRRTYVQFADVVYNTPLDDRLFQVGTFGETFISAAERTTTAPLSDDPS